MQDEDQEVRRRPRRRGWVKFVPVIIVGIAYGALVGIGARLNWWDEAWVTAIFLVPVALLLVPDFVKMMRRRK